MANNIVPGQNLVYAKITGPIASTGINTANVSILYKILPTVNQSFVPGRAVNAFTMINEGQSYFLIALQPIDLSEYFRPPFDENGESDWEIVQW